MMNQRTLELRSAELRLKTAGQRLAEIERTRLAPGIRKITINKHWSEIWADRKLLLTETGTYPGRQKPAPRQFSTPASSTQQSVGESS